MENNIKEKLEYDSHKLFGCEIKELTASQLYSLIGGLVNSLAEEEQKVTGDKKKRAAYFSAEFLIGSLTESNLFNLGIYEAVEDALKQNSRTLKELDDIPDYAFGNGGLGRLAACFLDSAASKGFNLDGYGIRYKYGLFRQEFKDGSQIELPDKWDEYGDPFGIEKKDESVIVEFSDFSVRAVPYDYYVIGYQNGKVNRLRLYESESMDGVDYFEFERGNFEEAYKPINRAKAITAFLYPNDNTNEGKKLRLRQEYFFASAALQNILNEIFDKNNLVLMKEKIAIQLNDTHPVIAIPEFIRLMKKRGVDFETALSVAQEIFNYTNHTVMNEALEKWDENLFKNLLPDVYEIVVKLNQKLASEVNSKNKNACLIIKDSMIHMANLACFVSSHINGVAEIHSRIIAEKTLGQWYELYPEKFSNKTNGITQRRWLAIANRELYVLSNTLANDDVAKNLDYIKKAAEFADDNDIIEALGEIRMKNKKRLCESLEKSEGIKLNPDSIFFVHAKRIHEYKRQLMCALAISSIYRSIKNGEYPDLPDMTFIFAGKAAAGYKTAKSIIRYINCLASVINSDKSINGRLKVVFVRNYNVSVAEKIFPAADYSLQISQAGTEASGTGNMKLMLNGAVTIGTYDGANIEIVREAGEEKNYIFGLSEREVSELSKKYEPKRFYNNDGEIKKSVDTLVDTSFFSKPKMFEDVYKSLLDGPDGDRYMVLADLADFTETLLTAARDYTDRSEYFKKSLNNIASSSFFSSDRTISEYAGEIWNL